MHQRDCRPSTPILLATLVLAAALLSEIARSHPSLDEPIAQLSARLGKDSRDAAALLERGEFYRLAGDLPRAWQDFERARQIHPELPGLNRCRAGVLLDAGSARVALEIVDRELARDPDDPGSRRLRAHALELLHRTSEAASELRRLEAADPPTPELFLEESRLLREAPEPSNAAALEALERGLADLGPVISLEEAAAQLEEDMGLGAAALERRDWMSRQMEDATLGRRSPENPARHPGSKPSGGHGLSAALTRGPYLQRGTPTGIVIRWRTLASSDSRVQYGPDPAHLLLTTNDALTTTEHEVVLAGLSPSTRYYYTVGSTSQVLAGGDSTYTFATSPRDGAARPVRIWVIGDSGLGNRGAADVRDSWLHYTGARPADVWLMLGDNAYFSGTDAEYQAGVFDMYPQILRQNVLWPTRGNHDLLYVGANNDYYDIFTLPTAGEAGGLPSGSEAYYSFDYLNIHFICLDSQNTDRSPGGAMMAWLRADLSATNQEWVICFWHHPPYSKGSHDSDNEADSGARMGQMRRNALPILDSLGVDLVLTGHSHSYERSFLLDRHYGTSGTLLPSMKLDSGDGREGGNGAYTKATDGKGAHQGTVYAVAGSSAQASGGTLNHPAMYKSLNVMGSMVLDVNVNRLHALFLDSQGQPRDSFDLYKPLPAGGVAPHAPRLRLAAPVPNPSTQSAALAFELPRAGLAQLDILDAQGRRVITLARESMSAGAHTLSWDGHNHTGNPVGPGVYFAVLQHEGQTRTRKVTRLP